MLFIVIMRVCVVLLRLFKDVHETSVFELEITWHVLCVFRQKRMSPIPVLSQCARMRGCVAILICSQLIAASKNQMVRMQTGQTMMRAGGHQSPSSLYKGEREREWFCTCNTIAIETQQQLCVYYTLGSPKKRQTKKLNGKYRKETGLGLMKSVTWRRIERRRHDQIIQKKEGMALIAVTPRGSRPTGPAKKSN